QSAANRIGHITLGVKRTGERSAGKPPAPFDVAGGGDGSTVGLLRHSQRKRGVPAMPRPPDTAPALDPTSGGGRETDPKAPRPAPTLRGRSDRRTLAGYSAGRGFVACVHRAGRCPVLWGRITVLISSRRADNMP